jgi:hypothetical protein
MSLTKLKSCYFLDLPGIDANKKQYINDENVITLFHKELINAIVFSLITDAKANNRESAEGIQLLYQLTLFQSP